MGAGRERTRASQPRAADMAHHQWHTKFHDIDHQQLSTVWAPVGTGREEGTTS